MLKEQRQQLIIEFVNKKNFVKIEEFLEIIKTSEITLRRDINYLHDKNLILKVHGGAQSINKNANEDFLLNQRSKENIKEKKEIALKASLHIVPKTHIYLDAGTTLAYLIPFLANKDIVVYTHGVHHIGELLKYDIKTFIIGGFIKSITNATVGEYVVNQINQFNFDIAFLGTNAMDEVFGFSTPDISEALIKESIIKQSKNSYVLADQSKFQKKSYVSFGKITDVDQIITN